jgi:hypothetical protein
VPKKVVAAPHEVVGEGVRRVTAIAEQLKLDLNPSASQFDLSVI